MHIMLVVHQFDDAHIGGTERYTLNLARGLELRGHRVTVLTFAAVASTKVILKDSEVAGLAVLTLQANLDVCSTDPVRESYAGELFLPALQQAIDKCSPDVLHITHPGNLGLSLVDICAERQIPVVTTLTDYWAVCPNSRLLRVDGTTCSGPVDIGQCARCLVSMGPRGARLSRVARWTPNWVWRVLLALSRTSAGGWFKATRWLASLEARTWYIRKQLGKVATVFCPGAFQRDMLIVNGLPERLVHAPHGIVSPDSLSRVREAHEGTRFAYIGPIAEFKGALLPVQAFSRLGPRRDVTLEYWGASADTPYATRVWEAISMDDRVQHRGLFSYDQVGDVLAGIDVLIVPSVWYENTPTILYEAFAAGVPVIASDLGGMHELVQVHHGGWLVEPGSVTALTEKMRQLAEDPMLVAEMSKGILAVPDFESHLAVVVGAYERLVRS